MSAANPVLVEVLRGDLVESRHRGAVAVVDAAGTVVRAWGDIERPVYPRSANKPLQAIALIETGAADACGADDAELALACASHHAEPRHVGAVAAWLSRLGLGPTDLECGAQTPTHPPSLEALIRAGAAPSALHNNCSGKHTGMLATALHCGEPTRGYIGYDHPVQRRVTQTLAELYGLAAAPLPWGIDGCGIPTVAVPLRALARGLAQLADPGGLAGPRAAAARRLTAAITAQPMMIGGVESTPSRLTEALAGTVIAKSGAEGVFAAMLPTAGWGIALKIDDGAGRAAEFALAMVLERLGLLDPDELARLHRVVAPELHNRVGRVIGALRAGVDFAP
jgi:L-asparaginase II